MRLKFSTFALLASATSVSAYAQSTVGSVTPQATTTTDQQALTPATTSADQGLQDIVVTAQRRGENLQRVPISVTAITADAAKTQGIVGTTDLPMVVPGLVMTPYVGNPVIYLRGVGTDQVSGGTESSVATYVDGVYMANLSSTIFSFNNIERIEVLKGPQGTLFGRNASGGVINVVTRTPSSTPSLEASLGYASYDTVEAQLYGTTGIANGIAIDFSGYYRNQGEGWGTNIYDGSPAYKDRTYAVRSKQRIDAWTGGQFILSEDYSYLRGSISAGRQPIPGTFGAGLAANTGSFYTIDFNEPSYEVSEGGGGSIRFEQDLGGPKLVNLAAYRSSVFNNFLDQDGTPQPFVNSQQHYLNHYFSNEIQIQAATSSKIKWIAGFYFLDMHDRLDPLILAGINQAANGGSSTTTSQQLTRSYAGFAQATVPLGSRTNLTGGVRYTRDSRDFQGETITAAGKVTASANAEKSWGSWSYKAAIDHQLADQVMIYASQSSGFKSGQFNPINPANPPVAPETLEATEAGIKSQWLDNALRINIAGFYYDYKNLQLTQRTNTGLSLVLNAASATIYGGEMSLLAQPVHNFTLRADASLLHARYDSFSNAPYLIPSPASCTPTPHTTGTPTGGNSTCTFDASGKTLTRSPTFTLDVGAHYVHDISFGTLAFDVSGFHSSGSFFTPDNRVKQAPYSVVNTDISMQIGEYSVRVWTKNLLGEKYYSNVLESIGDYYTPAAPRTIGVTFAVKLH